MYSNAEGVPGEFLGPAIDALFMNRLIPIKLKTQKVIIYEC